MDIHIQNPHKKVGGPLLAALAAAICSLLLPNCEGSHSVRLFHYAERMTTPKYDPNSAYWNIDRYPLSYWTIQVALLKIIDFQ